MAKGEDLIKFITQQVVSYWDMPKEERKQVRSGNRSQREPWATRWFGMLPLALDMWWRRFVPVRRKASRSEDEPFGS